MKIKEIKSGQGSVEVEAVVKELEEIKEFNKYGRVLKLRNAVIEDDSGAVKLSLWNDDVEKFKVGDKIKITNGYVNEFQGEKQLTSGKFGKIEKLGEGSVSETSDSSSMMETPEEAHGMSETSDSEAEAETDLEAESNGDDY